MLAQKEKLALKSLLKGTSIEKGRDWLIKVHLSNEEGAGWPHLTAQIMPTVWGGTNDGIRGLIASGMSQYEPIIQESFNWLLTQQREDGGFGSREILYSSVEPTAWVLITAKDMGINLKTDPHLMNALLFLESCIGQTGDLGTSTADQGRTYPSSLTLWALNGYSNKAISIARYLKDSRDTKSNGWGTKPNTAPNVLSTARVLHSLLVTGHLQPDDIIARRATEYILEHQKPDGSWDNFNETWYSIHQPHVPLRCDEYTTTWALIALLLTGLSPASMPLAKATSWLIHEQQDEGYWLYDPLDDSRHIWCTADCIYALSIQRQKLLQTMTDAGSELWELAAANGNGEQKNKGELWRDRLINFIRENMTNVLVVLLALYVFRDRINLVLSNVYSFLKLESTNLFTNIISDAIYALLIIVGAYALSKIRNKK